MLYFIFGVNMSNSKVNIIVTRYTRDREEILCRKEKLDTSITNNLKNIVA